MKIIKSIVISVIAVFAVLMIEPLRFFAGMTAVLVFGMLMDSIREIDKWWQERKKRKREEEKEK